MPERKGGPQQFDYVTGQLDPFDNTSGRQGLLIVKLPNRQGIVLANTVSGLEIWHLHNISDTYVAPKMLSDETKSFVSEWKKRIQKLGNGNWE